MQTYDRAVSHGLQYVDDSSYFPIRQITTQTDIHTKHALSNKTSATVGLGDYRHNVEARQMDKRNNQ